MEMDVVFPRLGVCQRRENFCDNLVCDNNDVLQNVARCKALISTRLNTIVGSLLVKAESDTANAGSVVSAETSGEERIDCSGQVAD